VLALLCMLIVTTTVVLGAIPTTSQTYAGILTLNWSGYVAAIEKQNPQQAVTGLRGTFTVPILITGTRGGMAAIWVGIGGILAGDSTLIQAGIEGNLVSNAAEYYAWYELFPGPQTKLPMAIHGGDKVSVTVALVKWPNHWKIVVENLATGKDQTIFVRYNSSMRSAEWMVEAPTVCGDTCKQQSLPYFEKVVFTNSTATVCGVEVPIDGNWYDSIVLVKLVGNMAVALTENSPLLYHGTSFVVRQRDT